MLLVLLLLAAPFNDNAVPVVDRCDVIEVNHYYIDSGAVGPGFWRTQIIFWDWDNGLNRFVICDYKVVAYEDREEGRVPYQPSLVPRRNNGLWYCDWYADNYPDLRIVIAKNMCESWTDYDREFINKEVFPQSLRRGLTPTRKKPVAKPVVPPSPNGP